MRDRSSLFSFAPVLEGIWGECSGHKGAELGGARGRQGGPLGLKARLAGLNSALSLGMGVPRALAVSQEGKGLRCLMKSPGLLGALAGHLRSCSEQQMQAKAKVIAPSTSLASFQASLGINRGSLGTRPLRYSPNQN